MTRFELHCLVSAIVSLTLSALIQWTLPPKPKRTRQWRGARAGVISVGKTVQTSGVLLG